MGPSAASRKAALTSSANVFFSTWMTRSTTETLGVGTRSAMPLSLPLSLGSTSATALAAPVVVGTMLSAAARARRRSRCDASSRRWSPVYECVVVIVPLTMPNFSSSTCGGRGERGAGGGGEGVCKGSRFQAGAGRGGGWDAGQEHAGTRQQEGCSRIAGAQTRTRTLTKGARQLVVHDALEMIVSLCL